MRSLFDIKLAALLVVCALLSACATAPLPNVSEQWMADVLNYEASLEKDHKDSLDNMFQITPEMRETVVSKFSKFPNSLAAKKLAMWLVDQDGKGMKYNVEANLSPQQAYTDNRGNCLSFTILMVELAEELGIKLLVNEVDLPDFWSENEERDLIFYRHVNAIYRTERMTQVFDLAIEEYGKGYPQRIIEKRQAAALLFSNIGIQELQKEHTEQGLHYLKLAVSMNPNSSDMWINLAAALKQSGRVDRAEQAYLHAVSLNDRNSIAASNLERLYHHQGRHAQAEKFRKLAIRARRKNPYIHFRNAQVALNEKNYLRSTCTMKTLNSLRLEASLS